MEGKTARGASSPAKPALHIPENKKKVKSKPVHLFVQMKNGDNGEKNGEMKKKKKRKMKNFTHQSHCQ
jgi:hypothetical protein